ncbi:MAG TPA: hypothetical protein VGU71_08495 [Candidatus Dormibacteraeota bacterium]|nr:hypothetical protein [Candidatus Dormibacteraeota bacterium]
MSTPTPDPAPLVTNDALQAEVNLLVRQGYRVVSQSELAAHLVKAKKFSIIWAIIWFVIAVFPFVIYLIYYMFKWEPGLPHSRPRHRKSRTLDRNQKEPVPRSANHGVVIARNLGLLVLADGPEVMH